MRSAPFGRLPSRRSPATVLGARVLAALCALAGPALGATLLLPAPIPLAAQTPARGVRPTVAAHGAGQVSGAILARPRAEVQVSSASTAGRATAGAGEQAAAAAARAGGAGRFPIAFALVELTSSGVRRTAVTDAAGRYLLRDVPAGYATLRALHVGYASGEIEVLVPADVTVEVDLELSRHVVPLPPLVVMADPVVVPEPVRIHPTAPPATLGETAVTLRTLEASPGLAESGLGEAARSIGGGEPSDPADVLFMRGSTTDLKLVLLDGAPVYTPFHLGGLLQSFDGSAFSGAALHLGGAPARYDGGLSYILDLRTRSPKRDRLRVSGAADLLSARATLEAPLGDRAGVFVTSRALHGLAGAVLGGDGSPYGYGDVLLRLEGEPATRHRLSLTAFGNRESVFLDAPASASRLFPEAARWGNAALSAGYHAELGASALDVTLAASRYDAELPLRPRPRTGPDTTAPAVTGPFLASGETERLRFAVDLSTPLASGALRYGGSVDRLRTSYGARLLAGSSGGTDGPDEAPVAVEGTVAGAYVDGVRRLGTGVDLRLGLRADHFSTDGRVRLAPRATLLWEPTPTATFTLAVGRYHQYTRTTDEDVERTVEDVAFGAAAPGSGQFTPSGGASSRLLPVATADHFLIGLDQRLTPNVQLGVEGYLKGYSGVSGREAPAFRSSGLDLRVLRQGEAWTAWTGYSLSWFWSGDATSTTTSEFTGRHLLSAGAAGPLAGALGADLRLSFSDGLPFTSLPFGREGVATDAGPGDYTVSSASRPNSEVASGSPALSGGLTDSFLRLDVELYAELTPSWGGRETHVRPYLRVLNALRRRDALFWYFDPWRDEQLRPLAQLSLLPVLGLEWRF